MLESIVLILLAGSALYGLKKGFISQAASLAGIVLGIVACRLLGNHVAHLMNGLLPDKLAQSPFATYAATILGSIALFLVVGIAVTVLATSVKFLSRILLLGWVDRAAGVLMGLAKMAIVLSIVLNLWFIVSPPTPEKEARYSQGTVLPVVMGIAPHLLGAGDEYQNTDFENERGQQRQQRNLLPEQGGI